jgi:hypothetical protein
VIEAPRTTIQRIDSAASSIDCKSFLAIDIGQSRFSRNDENIERRRIGVASGRFSGANGCTDSPEVPGVQSEAVCRTGWTKGLSPQDGASGAARPGVRPFIDFIVRNIEKIATDQIALPSVECRFLCCEVYLESAKFSMRFSPPPC